MVDADSYYRERGSVSALYLYMRRADMKALRSFRSGNGTIIEPCKLAAKRNGQKVSRPGLKRS